MGSKRLFGSLVTTRGAYRALAEARSHVARFASLPFVLVHVPKNGGTSILQAIEPKPMRVHATAWEIRTVCPAEILGKELVGVYRDPLDRFASAWRYYRRGGNGGRADARIQVEIEQFERRDHHSIELAKADLRDLARANRAFWPQSAYLLDVFGALCVDRLMRFETLTDDFATYSRDRRLSLPRIGHANVAPRDDIPLPDVVLAAATEVYAADHAIERQLRPSSAPCPARDASGRAHLAVARSETPRRLPRIPVFDPVA